MSGTAFSVSVNERSAESRSRCSSSLCHCQKKQSYALQEDKFCGECYLEHSSEAWLFRQANRDIGHPLEIGIVGREIINPLAAHHRDDQ